MSPKAAGGFNEKRINLLYLKDGEGEGMSQEVHRLKDPLPFVSVQVHAAEDVQLGVHPVQPAFDQVCRDAQVGTHMIGPEPEPSQDTCEHLTGLNCSVPTECDSVGPLDVGPHQNLPVHSVHASLLNLGWLAPVGPVQEPTGPTQT